MALLDSPQKKIEIPIGLYMPTPAILVSYMAVIHSDAGPRHLSPLAEFPNLSGSSGLNSMEKNSKFSPNFS